MKTLYIISMLFAAFVLMDAFIKMANHKAFDLISLVLVIVIMALIPVANIIKSSLNEKETKE